MKRTNNEPIRVRIYKRIVREWFSEWKDGRQLREQVEVEYEDYDEYGCFCGRGTEDFSNERFNKQTNLYWIYTWDGEKRNLGGKRWFEPQGIVRIRNIYGEKKRVADMLRHSYAWAAELQLR